jgi:hypothetical protein
MTANFSQLWMGIVNNYRRNALVILHNLVHLCERFSI